MLAVILKSRPIEGTDRSESMELQADIKGSEGPEDPAREG
jgi:hypothetical protein